MKRKLALCLLFCALLTLLCATALACPNPDKECLRNDYQKVGTTTSEYHTLRCVYCDYTFNESHWGGENSWTCTERRICGFCEEEYGDELEHSFTSYTPGNATCTADGAKTAVCDRKGCNATDTIVDIDTALGHTWATDAAVAPTCTQDGKTEGQHCSVCQTVLAEQEALPARGHYYGEWKPNGDDTHTALCKRDGCKHTSTVVCELAENNEFSLCPVCGDASDGARLSAIEDAKGAALTGKLPGGEIIVRMGTTENGETILCVGFEQSGKLTQPTGQVRVTLPAALLEGYTLLLLGADGAESELPFAVEGEYLSFRLDFTPDGDAPVRLIRLIPA